MNFTDDKQYTVYGVYIALRYMVFKRRLFTNGLWGMFLLLLLLPRGALLWLNFGSLGDLGVGGSGNSGGI